MGLDMYIYRVEKPTLDPTKLYDPRDLDDYVVMPPDVAGENNYKDVIPYSQKLRVRNEYYNIEKMKQNSGLTDLHLSMISGGNVSFSGRDAKGERKSLTFTFEEVEKEYTRFAEEECYVFWCEEVAYWRKEYALQDFFYSNLPVENVGYYLLSGNLIKLFNSKYNENIPVEIPTETTALFYHEWY